MGQRAETIGIMPTLHEALKARFSMVRRDLDRVLGRYTEDDYHWAPTEGMRTVHGQLFEIVGKEVELLDYAKKGGKEGWIEIEEYGEREKTLAGMREVLAEYRKATFEFIDSQTESDLEKPVSFPTDWWEGMGLSEMPMHEVLRTLAMHEWYHTGQLYSYLWSRGDDPYKW